MIVPETRRYFLNDCIDSKKNLAMIKFRRIGSFLSQNLHGPGSLPKQNVQSQKKLISIWYLYSNICDFSYGLLSCS